MKIMQNIVVYGATSDIAQAIISHYLIGINRLILIARNKEKLDIIKQHYGVFSNCEIITIEHEACNFESLPQLMAEIEQITPTIDIFILAHGILTDQQKAYEDNQYFQNSFLTNFNSVVLILKHIADFMKKGSKGTICCISSVAGERGRYSNYYYGSAKAGLTTFLSGLRANLHPYGIKVLTIKPGFVDTKMTAHIKKNFLFATPEDVSIDIVKAINRQRNVIYTPTFWRLIMFIVRSIPETFFKRMKL